ncbi:MAG: peptidoglycan DD-metalloendopeptidase family protein [Bacillota bacterium]
MSEIINRLEIKGSKFKFILIFGVITLLIASGLMFAFTPNKGIAVKVDSKQLGIIENETFLTEALEELKAEKAQELRLSLKDAVNSVEVDNVEGYKGEPLTKEALKAALKPHMEWFIDATAISINGEPRIYLASASQGEEVINKLKEEYLKDLEGKEILSTEFEEDVKVEAVQAKLSQLVAPDRAIDLIINGTDKIETYKVKKGDTLWDIAHGNNMTVNELKEANPELTKEVLSIGQELKLVKTDPMVHVVSTVKYTQEEKIPFDTKYISSSDLWRGQNQVKEPGKSGKQQVTYEVVQKNGVEINRNVLDKIVLEEPKTKVVYQGTKLMVASRGGGGNGELAWPLRGRITSGYGWRRLGFHTGLDIDGLTGDPIFAAESGVVLTAGWNGNYGYSIDIDHGDGLMTRYAHLSKMDVRTGQKVKRGDLIGRVGNTGRSTGSHLHFEVRVNGNHLNPIKYLD